jgi:DNA segregation ATPase FtsK/SpoIIIE, S-DNA-T family
MPSSVTPHPSSVTSSSTVLSRSTAASTTPSTPKSGFARGREAASLLLFATSIFTLLALLSFRGSPVDAAIVGPNWVGPVGSALAKMLVRSVGVISWVVPVELLLLTWPLLKNRSSIATGARVAGDLLVAIILAALTHVAFPQSLSFGAMPIGGRLGELFGEIMVSLFSTVGSFLVGLTAVGLILIGRASFSFIRWAQKATKGTEVAAQTAKQSAKAVANAWERATDLRKEREAEQKASGPAPAIHDDHASEQVFMAALSDDREVSETPLPPVTRVASDSEQLDPTLTPLAPSVKTVRSKKSNVNININRSNPANLSPPAELDASPNGNGHRFDETPLAPPVESKVDTTVNPKKTPAPKRGKPARQSAVRIAPDPTAASPLPAAIAESDTPAPPTQASPSPVPSVPTYLQPSPSPVPVTVEFMEDSMRDLPSPAPTKLATPGKKNSSVELPVIDHPETVPVDRSPPVVKAAPREAERRVLVPSVDEFRLPPTELFDEATETVAREDNEVLLQRASELERVLSNYGVKGNVADIHTGPTVSTFELNPAEGTKVSKVAGLADDLALGLSCTVRIIAPIPGKSRIGFEIPNRERIPVNLRELIEEPRFLENKAPLPVVLGRDIVGAPFYADLASMPHVLVAGATGAGKSVGLNVMMTSLLTRRTPEELRMLLIDPKVVELAPFDRIPHLLLPVVTDMKQASTALKWAVDEMERRYQLFANAGTKNITTYNRWVEKCLRGEVKAYIPPKTSTARTADGSLLEVGPERETPKLPDKLPWIVIVVDEFADLIMQQGKDVESSVARLAQKARAAGMHVILATQRPSVDVITGMIKANFPTRIAFRVSQRVDSRTILDEQGAEHLLGRGDMLVRLNGTNETRRVQCPFVSEEEVQRVTDWLRLQGEPVYDDTILAAGDEEGPGAIDDAEMDAKFDEAVRIVAETRRCSTSWLQRKLGIGYNRAAKIVEVMEKRGMVGPANGSKDREVLIGPL